MSKTKVYIIIEKINENDHMFDYNLIYKISSNNVETENIVGVVPLSNQNKIFELYLNSTKSENLYIRVKNKNISTEDLNLIKKGLENGYKNFFFQEGTPKNVIINIEDNITSNHIAEQHLNYEIPPSSEDLDTKMVASGTIKIFDQEQMFETFYNMFPNQRPKFDIIKVSDNLINKIDVQKLSNGLNKAFNNYRNQRINTH